MFVPRGHMDTWGEVPGNHFDCVTILSLLLSALHGSRIDYDTVASPVVALPLQLACTCALQLIQMARASAHRVLPPCHLTSDHDVHRHAVVHVVSWQANAACAQSYQLALYSGASNNIDGCLQTEWNGLAEDLLDNLIKPDKLGNELN